MRGGVDAIEQHKKSDIKRVVGLNYPALPLKGQKESGKNLYHRRLLSSTPAFKFCLSQGVRVVNGFHPAPRIALVRHIALFVIAF